MPSKDEYDARAGRLAELETAVDRQITQLKLDVAQQTAAIEQLKADVQRLNIAVAVILTHET